MDLVPVTPEKSLIALTTQSEKLRNRLRTIKRFRRQSLTSRAMRVDAILSDILVDLNAQPRERERENSASTKSQKSSISPEEHQRLLALLDHSRQEYDSLIDFIDAERTNGIALSETAVTEVDPWKRSSDDGVAKPMPRPLSNDVSILHNQIEFLEQELEGERRAAAQKADDECTLREQIEVLRTQLLESRHETIELRIQNSDLADRKSGDLANMTWAQRKVQLLQQLEAETSDAPAVQAEKLEIATLIEISQDEISQRDKLIVERDREIEELQMLLTRQSSVTNGVAIGAAAVAQILDADEFVQAERENLRLLQLEWEGKLRTAEIEISLERARIARERLEFESDILSLQAKSDSMGDQQNFKPSDQEPLGKPRRWLRRLGLRDD